MLGQVQRAQYAACCVLSGHEWTSKNDFKSLKGILNRAKKG